jgi:YVTN family beta-propeller protein
MRLSAPASAFVSLCLVSACHVGLGDRADATDSMRIPGYRLSTGVHLDPVGTSHDLGSLPLSMITSPDSKHFVVVNSGYWDQGFQIVDRATGEVVQTVVQPAAFIGAAFSSDGRELFVSGGDRDVVYRYAWISGRAELRDSIVLGAVAPREHGVRYPAGIGASRDGRWLYVAENLADSLAVIDLTTSRVTQRFATERYPYDVAVRVDGGVYVSAWGGHTVSAFRSGPAGLVDDGRIVAGRHPSALLLNHDGTRLFVASGSTDRVNVIDTQRRVIVARLLDAPPEGPGEGSTPNGLALSADETRLYVAEADANAVAIFDLSPATASRPAASGDDRLSGRVPAGWYPTGVAASGDSLFVVNGKGRGSQPNPRAPQPISRERRDDPNSQYTLHQVRGSITVSTTATARGDMLRLLTSRVIRANGWDKSPTATGRRYPPFQHVIYIIKENRTYDQVLGDLKQADGDTSLLFFPRSVSPNHHALAERFGLFDRFFVNAEVSADGHNWSTAAYASDYVEKTVQSNYSGRGRSYDYEGGNRGYDNIPEDDVNEPASGYLWNLAEQKGITLRNYGEFVTSEKTDAADLPVAYRGNKPFLFANTNPRFPGFNLDVRDQVRADIWLQDLAEFARVGRMPALQIMRLPNDHTSGARAGAPTPRAHMADNDLALGRVIEALSRSPFWKNTVVFVLEDDAQNGPDHVDSHRSPLLVISAYNRPAVIHRFANTTDVLRTMEEILGLSSLSHFDYFGRPLREIWSTSADLRPYHALTPAVSLDEKNPASTPEARQSQNLDLDIEDVAEEDLFNRVLWATIKGREVPYPGARRISSLELRQ